MRGRPKLPLSVAKASGAYDRNPKRYTQSEVAAVSPPLGDPTPMLSDAERDAWYRFLDEMPWLCESDRALTEAACRLRVAAVETGELKVMAELRQHLERMGGTPTSRRRVNLGGADTEAADEFLG